eukprot:Plantae.Rhodophyta-Hildenbrandia_rubra.ctg554.p1 GENE.Plantae.Rhodophyta-Hildenbrandia_rubra.ctg554~~Plantae.Rhodophyta-Hildenbrandia_rubra.ctg554.p1  ORF type:complete len:737 (-),score=139.25 Plantae.Rhodophyta-Hildenbrandia_rubra.ctg554:6754-8964(-)
MGAAPSAVAQPLPTDSALYQVLKTSSTKTKSHHRPESTFWSRAFAEHAAVTHGKRKIIGDGMGWDNVVWDKEVVVQGLKAAAYRVRRVGVGEKKWSGGVREAGLALLFMRRVLGLKRLSGGDDQGEEGFQVGQVGNEVVDAVVRLIERLAEVVVSGDVGLDMVAAGGEGRNGGGAWEMWSPRISGAPVTTVNDAANRHHVRDGDKERVARRFEMLAKLLYCAIVVLLECVWNERWSSFVLQLDGANKLISSSLRALLMYKQNGLNADGQDSLTRSSSLLSSISLLRTRIVSTLRLEETVFSTSEKENGIEDRSTLTHVSSFLHVLIVLVSIDGYRDEMCKMFKAQRTQVSPSGQLENGNMNGDYDATITFSALYECLGALCHTAAGVYLAYVLIANHKRFKTFVLARTDPEVLVLPLLESGVSKNIGDDPYDMGTAFAVSILLLLTEDFEFCEALGVGMATEERSLGLEVLYVASRALQSAVIDGNPWIARACLALMANVSCSLGSVDSLTADRLVTLIDVLTKKHKKLCAAQMVLDRRRKENNSPMGGNRETANGYIPEMESNRASQRMSRSHLDADDVGDLLGGLLEIILGLVETRSSKRRNRHVHYTLLHRGSLLRDSYIAEEMSTRISVLVSRLRALVEFLEVRLDAGEVDAGDGGTVAIGLSVESVFEVIEQYGPRAPKWIWSGLPPPRYRFEKADMDYGKKYARLVVNRYIEQQDKRWEWNYGSGRKGIP